MWRWATSSRRTAAGVPGLVVLGLVALGLALWGSPAEARVYLTVDEALALAFPDCEVERQTVFLTAEQKTAIGELAGEPLETGIVYPYRATCGGEPGGVVYFDTHRVRTLPETLMIVVDPEGKIRRLEILSFKEPVDYIPPEGWYGQFLGKSIGKDLQLKRSIQPVTGATLTARATLNAVRRALAIEQVLEKGSE